MMTSDCPNGFTFIAITGRPGIGKTTIFRKIYEFLANSGLKIAGFYCPEIRERGRRIGFRIRSMDGEMERWLAKIKGCDGPTVGRYTLCSEAVEVIKYVVENIGNADVVMVDEIGPMELKVKDIKRAIVRILDLGKPGIFVVHERLRDRELRKRLDGNTCWFQITLDNRDYILKPIIDATNDVINRLIGSYSSQ